jgi:hypothetical protein
MTGRMIAALLWAGGVAHAAAPSLHAAAVMLRDRELEVIAAGRRGDGSWAPLPQLRLAVGGKEVQASARCKVGELLAAHPEAAPPIAVALAYLWSARVPHVADAVEAFAGALPPRVPVIPTPYGGGEAPKLARTTAAAVAAGDLSDLEWLGDAAAQVLPALEQSAVRLLQEEAPLRHLVIVSDGAVAVASARLKGLGRNLRARGIATHVLALCPLERCAPGLAELAQAAEATLTAAPSPTELRLAAAALGSELAGAALFEFRLPWQVVGGPRNLRAQADIDRAVATADLGVVAIPGSPTWIALGVALCGLGGAVARTWRRRASGRSPPSASPAEPPTLCDRSAAILADALAAGWSPAEAARALASQLPSERVQALTGTAAADLAGALGEASTDFPSLECAAALKLLLAVQRELRAADAGTTRAPLAPAGIAWLVRAGGPGPRGQALPIRGSRTRFGRGPGCAVQLPYQPVGSEMAEIRPGCSGFELVALAPGVRVDGTAIEGACALADGQLLELGRSRFRFHCVGG